MIAASERRHFTADEFNRMAEAGIFAPGERVELVEGVLISYAPPHGPLHAGAVFGFPELMRAKLGGRAVLWSRLPVIVSGTSELEPDLALLRIADGSYRKRLPRASDVLAAIEMADTSLRSDRLRKLRVYAGAGIPEYWLVDLRRERIEVYREPRGAEYAAYRLASRDDRVAFAAFPDSSFSVDELLG